MADSEEVAAAAYLLVGVVATLVVVAEFGPTPVRAAAAGRTITEHPRVQRSLITVATAR
jgi:hypothetical protein